MYTLISAIILSLLAICWKSDYLLNFVIKILLVSLSVWGIFMFLTEQGYVVKQ